MFAGRAIACAAGAALVACLGTAGVAGASGVRGTACPVGGCAVSACVHVDENRDGVCDNCGAARDVARACPRCGCEGCDGICDRAGRGACEACGREGCDGTCACAHDGACGTARAGARHHGGR